MRLCDSCRNRKIKEKSIFSDCKIATSEKENLLLLNGQEKLLSLLWRRTTLIFTKSAYFFNQKNWQPQTNKI